MKETNKPQDKLNSKQIKTIWLLSIGTFLEYFDLMLYVHLAVILNDLFFPKVDDPQLKFIITSITFCATFIMRPFGALFFGWIGDKVGRRHTVIAATFLMGVSCIIMGSIPTYKTIGITATITMLFCRMLQGVSSIGEKTGALVYLNEFIKAPAKYVAVAIIPFTSSLGSIAALGVVNLIMFTKMNWRFAFLAGAVISLVGAKARTALRETPEFVDAIKRTKNHNREHAHNFDEKQFDKDIKFYEEQNKSIVKESTYLFILECLGPLCFYLVYFYCGDLLKVNFNYTSAMILKQNLFLTSISLTKYTSLIWLCSKFNPLSIVKYQLYIISSILIIFPLFLYLENCSLVLLVQILIAVFGFDIAIASSCMYEHFPVFKRFRAVILMRALSHTGTYVLTSFGLAYVVNKLGFISISFFSGILCFGAIVSLRHFIKLQKEKPYK